jgi:hypothetical protein
MAMPTVRLPQVRLILCMGDELQMVGIPAGVDAALVVELSAFGNRTAKKLPAESVGVAVLGLGHAAVRRCCSREPPAGAELGIGRFEDGAVEQAFQLRTASGGLAAVRWLGHVGSRDRRFTLQEPMARARQFGRGIHKGVKDPGCPRSFDSGCRRRRLGRFSIRRRRP